MITLQRDVDGNLLRFGTGSGELQGQCICQQFYPNYNFSLNITDGTCPTVIIIESFFEESHTVSTGNRRPYLNKCTYYYHLFPDIYYGTTDIYLTFEILGGVDNEVKISFVYYYNNGFDPQFTIAKGSLIVQDVPLVCGSMVCTQMEGSYIIPFDSTGASCTDGYATITRL